MPVVWGAVKDRVEEEIEIANENTRPIKIWIALGEGGGGFTVEKIGHNHRGKPGKYKEYDDNNGGYPRDGIVPNKNWDSNKIDHTFPLSDTKLGQDIRLAFNNRGGKQVKFEVSLDAGRFICDETTYNIYGKTGSGLEHALFFHVPKWGGKTKNERESILQKLVNNNKPNNYFPLPLRTHIVEDQIANKFADDVVSKTILNLGL
ncbi:MAG: hypothetical protein MPJ24_11545, partial [Pirellulaceae bacterium]|nr:hypothetical protein [Pirellulaceae bacterium]